MPLDPVLAKRLPLLDGVASWDDPRAASFSAPVTAWKSPPLDVMDSVADGELPVKIRIYRAARVDCALLWIHGGAFVGGDLDFPESDYVAREIAHRANAAVVTVDYRLAIGGVHYPAPLDDVLAAWNWLIEHVIVPVRVIGGASAGGNLAAGATLRLRDSKGPSPTAVVLAYPALHPVLPPLDDELRQKMAALPPLLRFDSPRVSAIADNYVGGAATDAEIYAMPGLADPTGFPRTLIVNSEYDALRASGEAFGEALNAAGVHVSCIREKGVLHGHLNTIRLAGAERTLDRIAAFLRTVQADC